MTVRSLALGAVRTLDRLVPDAAGIAVLIYHRVGGGSSSRVDLEVSEFEAHLEHLAQRHRVLTLDAAVEALRSGTPQQGVVVTFDDGTVDFAEHAVPLLVKYGVPATLYAATSFIESGQAFPWGAPPISWSALGDSMSTGLVTVGSHTHSHRLLRDATEVTARDELSRSVELIGDRLGAVTRHFAHPKAVPGSRAAERVVRSMFVSAALAGNGANRAGRSDLHRLHRTPVQRDEGMAVFERRASGGMRLEGAARAAVTRVRYRGAVT